jgi:predicted nucleic acid-binding protein
MPDRVLFDTSSIVAGMLQHHAHHANLLPWMKAAVDGTIRPCICAHSIAETYNTLTHPRGYALPLPDAVKLIDLNIYSAFDVLPITPADYKNIIMECAATSTAGPMIYDRLIGYVAWKNQADLLLTINKPHFDTLFPSRIAKIVSPLNTSP